MRYGSKRAAGVTLHDGNLFFCRTSYCAIPLFQYSCLSCIEYSAKGKSIKLLLSALAVEKKISRSGGSRSEFGGPLFFVGPFEPKILLLFLWGKAANFASSHREREEPNKKRKEN